MFKNFLKNKKIENALTCVNNDPENIIKLDALGRLYFEDKFYKEGIEVFEKIINIDPKYLPGLELLSKAYIKTKQYFKAFEILKKLYSYLPYDFKIKTMLLTLKNADCEIEELIEIIEFLIEIDNNIELKEKLAKLYLKSGQFIKSATIFEELANNNLSEEYLIQLTNIYIKLNNISKAVNSLEKLMQTEFFKPQYAQSLAELYIKENRCNEAKDIFELLIKMYPEKSEFYNQKIAQIHSLENNPDKVIEITNTVLKKDKYSSEAKFLQVQALIDKNEYKKAVDFLRDFIFDPIDKKTEKIIIEKIIETSILYSQQLRENKKYAEAIDALIPALRYDDKNKNVYIELARISTEIKDFSSANEYMKIAETL